MSHRSVIFTLICILMLPLAGCAAPVIQTTPDVPTPTVTSPANAMNTPPTATTFPLAGRWSGKARNGDAEFEVTIHLLSDCALNEVCGSFDIPVVPCSGEYVLSGEQDGVYTFTFTNTSEACGEGSDSLQLLSDGGLKFTSIGSYGTNQGVLQRTALPVIFDDDGSPDGTVALLYLLSEPSATIKSVIISHGEAHPPVYIQHIGRMLADLGHNNIPLGAGAAQALIPGEDFPEWLRELADGFWGFADLADTRSFPTQDAAGLMVSLLKQSPEPLAIFVSGPCTDLALALRMEPSIKDKISGVYIMGGAAYVSGNLTDFSANPQNTSAEWNIYIDPLAASEVFSAGIPVVLIPLDATNQVSATTEDTKAWRQGDAAARRAADFYDMLLGGDVNRHMGLWDVMTAVIMTHPEMCPLTPLRLEVTTDAGDHYGQTVVIGVGDPNVQVCLNPNSDSIRNQLRETFKGE